MAKEAGTAFVAGAAYFVLGAAAIPVRHVLPAILLLSAAYIYAVVRVGKRRGPLYGVPFAIAAGLALDSFYIPPTRDFAPGDWQNSLVIAIYIGISVVIGMFATQSRRRAEAAERGRGLLAEEQAALRRVATLVACRVRPAAEVLAAVAREAGQLLDVEGALIGRYEADGTVTWVGTWSRGRTVVAAGTRSTVDGNNVTARVLATGRPARMDRLDDASGSVAVLMRSRGVRATVGVPIMVGGALWGVLLAGRRRIAPPDAEARMSAFTELAATAIANTAAWTEVRMLADEQAALRRVAMLVAEGVPQSELFGAVVEEVGRLLGTDGAGMIRYESDETTIPVAYWTARRGGKALDLLDARWSLEGGDLGTTIARTHRSARIDDYEGVPGLAAAFAREVLRIRSAVGCPIIVEGRLWGALAVHSSDKAPLPSDTEWRLWNFSELVVTAMSNAKARAELARLADGQAALRRVAELVAREPSPDAVFAAIAEEVGRLLAMDGTRLFRLETDRTATLVADWGCCRLPIPVGSRVPLDGESVAEVVRRTQRPARIGHDTRVTGYVAGLGRAVGVRSLVGAPIVVDGRVWGAIVAASCEYEHVPPDSEARLVEFAELAATAIANIHARSELAASRARIIAAHDQARRRVERDLHDGAQQRLVTLALELQETEAMVPDRGEIRSRLGRTRRDLGDVLASLRELSRGIHPAILSEGGLGPALRSLAYRAPLPTKLDLCLNGRFDEHVEVAAYYVVSEALTNAAKHARAAAVEVRAEIRDGILVLTIRDDGVGGADPSGGSGLTGLADRVEAVGGTLRVDSPRDEGTSLYVELPVGSA